VATATAEITPVVEEIMKLLPLLFYLLVFEPEAGAGADAMLVIAVSFATFENVCWLVENGAEQLDFLLLRGFGTGAMHVVCGGWCRRDWPTPGARPGSRSRARRAFCAPPSPSTPCTICC
jgi:hypothetical protein